jgi:hypothetical protein
MSYLDALAQHAEALGVTPGATSYFSSPSLTLDPTLFAHSDSESLAPWVRDGVLNILFDYLGTHYNQPHKWTTVWLAGSGVSYQWEASREPGDLDCLVGIDYVSFRQLNPNFVGMSDSEIASTFNDDFSKDLMPSTSNWHGYELTFYVNTQSDIKNINPYAAYNLTTDSWTVKPAPDAAPPYSRMWDSKVQRDVEMGKTVLNRYSEALQEIKSTSNPAYRTNAESKIKNAIAQGVALYDDMHAGRKLAFSRTGAGYADYNNYRWQAGKKSGIVPALRSMKNYHNKALESQAQELYGVTLPSTTDLIRRTALGR